MSLLSNPLPDIMFFQFPSCTFLSFQAMLLQTSASLKFTVLNTKGRIWTMVAGGGASVIYADTVSSVLPSFSAKLMCPTCMIILT